MKKHKRKKEKYITHIVRLDIHVHIKQADIVIHVYVHKDIYEYTCVYTYRHVCT